MNIIELVLAQDNKSLEQALKNGLDPNSGNDDYSNALELFCYCRPSIRSPGVFDYDDHWQASEAISKKLDGKALSESLILLIKYGLDVNLPINDDGEVVAHQARFVEGIGNEARVKLFSKTEMHIKNKYGMTPLLSGSFDSVSLLKTYVSAGADVEATDDEAKNVLWKCKDIECLKYAVEELNVDFNHKTIEGRTLLHDLDDAESIEYMIQKGCDIEQQDNEGKTPLYDSAIDGDPSKVAVFLKYGAVFSVDLIFAVLDGAEIGAFGTGAGVQIAERLMQQMDGDLHMLQAVLADDRDLAVEALRDTPSLLRYHDERGNSYLSLAICNEKYQVATAIIDAGFDFSKSEKSVSTKHKFGTLGALLDPDNQGLQFFDKLIQASFKSEKNTRETIQIRLDLLRRLVDAGFEKSPSVMAATGDLASLKKCIGSKTDLEDIEESFIPGESSELFLCAVGHNQMDVVKYLLELGVSADCDDSMDRETTALLRAVENDNFEMAKLLLEKGASPSLSNFAWHTPVHAALENNNQEILNLLVSFTDDEDKNELMELLSPAELERIGLN